MKFSEAWLREWVNPPVDREALFEQLTMAGLEVEGFERVAGEFSGVVVGEVVAVAAHPDADKLSVCEVDDGSERQQVVCGAPNVRVGLKSAFARVGAVLPENFRIRKANLRGVESRGMLCSAAELGLGDDHDGILELPASAVTGTELSQALALDDVAVELNLTPNRGDCLSIRGLAREVGVLNDMAVTPPVEGGAVPASINDTFAVALEAPDGCPRYLGRVIRGVDITRPSPLWLTEKLRRSGLRSIDAVVDVTNYVMLELGQPMHAFDLDRLDDRIVVRMARDGERLTLLDGQEVSLDATTLLITDGSGPVAMAGVMGGERSGTQTTTLDVFLECAYFAPLAVAGTARRYGLHTDAAHRYERGVDSDLQHRAMERASRLLLDIVGGEAGPVTEAVAPDHLPARRHVSLRERRLHELVGASIETAEVDGALARLDFALVERTVSESDGVCWTIEAPSHRFDIEREADLVEEICRIYGYNRVPARQPSTALSLRRVPLERAPEAELKRLLADLGFQEAITYSFVDPRLQDLLDPGVAALALENPMSSEQSVMRTTLLSGLVETLRVNLTRQQERVRLFEIGLCFLPGDPVVQQLRVGAVCCGTRVPPNWAQPAEVVDFFDVKGVVERLLAWTGQGDPAFVPARDPVLHPGQSAEIRLGDAVVGRLGRLHPEIEAKLDITKPVYLFEIQGEKLLARSVARHRGISRYPSVRRDLALLVARDVPAAALEATVRATLGEVLIDFTLFDVYQGKGIDSNEKSLAVGLTLQDASATLTEDRIARYMADVLAALERAVGARLRSGGTERTAGV
ncbi:MAG: phenylalanine--tRNA ligase subunit beta [Pseudomonadales bacterium]